MVSMLEMTRRMDFTSPAIGLVLLLLLNCGLDHLLADSDRCFYPVIRVDSLHGVDRSYAGIYAGDPRFEALSREMPSIRNRALRTAMEKTGLAIHEPETFVVRFKDTPRRSHFGASSQPIRAEQGDRVLITVSAGQFVLGVMDIHGSLVHEFIHGAMRQKMGSADYRMLPEWIREGIAVWGAGQLNERSRNVVATAFLDGRDPWDVLQDLENPRVAPDDYLPDALVFEYISQTYGEDSVHRLVAMLTDGDGPDAAFEWVTGLSKYSLRERCRTFTRAYFETLLAESGLSEFQAAQRLYHFGKHEEAIERLEDLLARHPDSLLEPNAWYWIGRWRYTDKQYAQASEAFATVLHRFPWHLGLVGDSQYRLAACGTKLEEYEKALDQLQRLIRIHSAAPRRMLADARYFLGLAQYRLGDPASAIHSLRQATQSGSIHAEEAFYHLSQAHLQAGNLFMARLACSELAYRFPRSRLLSGLREKLNAKTRS